MTEEAAKKSPSELLIEVLEKFSEHEPREVFVSFTTQDGDHCWYSSTDSMSQILGMIELAKIYLKRDIARLADKQDAT